MKITASHTALNEINEDTLIVPVFEGDTALTGALASLDHLTRGAVEALFEDGEISGKRDKWALLHNVENLLSRRVLLYGAGKPESLTALSMQRLAGAAIRVLSGRGSRSAAFLLREKLNNDSGVQALIEGAIMGQMDGGLYKSKDEPAREIELIHLVSESPDAPDFSRAIQMATVMAEAANFARKLGFEPGNVMTPTE